MIASHGLYGTENDCHAFVYEIQANFHLPHGLASTYRTDVGLLHRANVVLVAGAVSTASIHIYPELAMPACRNSIYSSERRSLSVVRLEVCDCRFGLTVPSEQRLEEWQGTLTLGCCSFLIVFTPRPTQTLRECSCPFRSPRTDLRLCKGGAWPVELMMERRHAQDDCISPVHNGLPCR